MKNQWSPSAGFAGIIVTVLLAAPSHVPSTFFIGLFCPFAIILGRVLTWVVGYRSWMLIPLITIDAIANAFWFMLVAETVRLLILRLRKA
jgi:hypothetical protein